MFKKAISILLSIILVLCIIPVASAATTASLYGIYGDSMLFQQNKDAIFAGTATTGAKITAELYDSANKLIRKYSSYAKDGSFEVYFPAPAGSYEEYTVVLYENGSEFDRLENIVFGELWLASGQSNMAYTLKQETTGSEMYAAGKKLSKWLRALIVPGTPKYNGSADATPVDPQNDIVGAKWVDGENEKIYSISAVAYFFADTLRKKIDMPVGIMHNALGGSTISTWLSRDAIDRSPNVKSFYTSAGKYITTSNWSSSAPERYQTMTANYNVKIHPTRFFRPSGMIWYQGESDLFNKCTPQQYADQLDLLQRSYSELYGYEDELMPLVCTQLAPFKYSSSGIEFSMWNTALSNFVDANPDVRGVVSNYDVSLAYLPDMGFIHPKTKQEIGVRMAECAEGLVYTGKGPTSVAYPKSYEISGSDIYIHFDKNVGDGLSTDSADIFGFAICAANGVYVPANAEIVDKDTVRVWAKGVTAPASATYAFCTNNVNSNLYSTKNGKLLMPVCPFMLEYIDGAHFWRDKEWLDCEEGNTFHNYGDGDGDDLYFYTWSGADLSFSEDAAYNGDYGLRIYTTRKELTIKPVLTYENDDGEDVPFEEIDTDYSDYSTLTFRIENKLPVEFSIESVDFYVGDTVLETYYSPVCTASGKPNVTVPASCPWVTVTFDLNTLYKNGKTSGSTYSNSKLEEVTEIKFNFSQEAGGAIVNLDEFRFTPENGNIGYGDLVDTPINMISKSTINANYTPADMSSDMPDSFNELTEVSLEKADNASTTIDNEKKLIYGIGEGLDKTTIMNHIKAVGSAEVSFSRDVIGTGTVITLTNTSTNEVEAEYTAVIFGDYNGDGIVDAEDTVYFAAISNFEIFDYYDYEYLFMAADINGDGVVDSMDEEGMNAVANFEAYIDQTVTDGSKVFSY